MRGTLFVVLSGALVVLASESLDPSDWRATLAEYEANRQAMMPAGSRYQASGPDQTDLIWRPRLKSYGRSIGAAQRIPEKARVSALANRSAYRWTASAGLNAKGKADFVVHRTGNGSVSSGTFTFGSVFWGGGMEPVVTGDLNADGRQNFISYNTTNGASYTCLSTGNAASPFTFKYDYWGNRKIVAR